MAPPEAIVAPVHVLGACVGASQEKPPARRASAVRVPGSLTREPEELCAVDVRETTPAPTSPAAAMALTKLRARWLDVAIAITRAAVVVRVPIAAVVLWDSAGCGACSRGLVLGAWSRRLLCGTVSRGFRRRAIAAGSGWRTRHRRRALARPTAAGDRHCDEQARYRERGRCPSGDRRLLVTSGHLSHTFPSPSLGPPLLSASRSPP